MARMTALISFLLVLSAGIVTAQHPQKEEAAVAVAQGWLLLVDQGKYSASWEEASEYFKNAVGRKQWEQSLQTVRRPLGKLTSRKILTQTYTTSLPGAPDGEYVVIQFNSSFENKKSAVETVTPMLEKDGKWRVSGYYIN